MDNLILHHGGYWISVVNRQKRFYSDVENHTTGKLITFIKFDKSTAEDRVVLMQYCAEELQKNGKFIHCKMANTDNNRNIVPLLFYSYTNQRDDMKQELKKIYQNLKSDLEHPLHHLIDKQAINFIFRWKLDSTTHQEIQNKTHWSLRSRNKLKV